MAHPFNFTQGKKFSRIGASWFVSYCYDDVIPAKLNNWNRVNSAPSRINLYNRTKWWVVDMSNNVIIQCGSKDNLENTLLRNPSFVRLHKYWMNEVMGMNEKKLARNSIRLSGRRVKYLANLCLNHL